MIKLESLEKEREHERMASSKSAPKVCSFSKYYIGYLFSFANRFWLDLNSIVMIFMRRWSSVTSVDHFL
jgi:hypothetical protein